VEIEPKNDRRTVPFDEPSLLEMTIIPFAGKTRNPGWGGEGRRWRIYFEKDGKLV